MKKKILSFLTAFAMVFGIIAAPFTTASAADGDTTQPAAEETTDPASETVTKKDVVGNIAPADLQDAKPDTTALTIHKLVADSYKSGVPIDHNGGSLNETDLGKLGTNVKGLPGVKFTIYKIEKAEDFKTIQDANPKTTDAMDKYVTANQATKVKETAATDDNGEVTENLAEGNYWVVESERPSRVTESLAVPFAITLSLIHI